jgi:hypothetical protein
MTRTSLVVITGLCSLFIAQAASAQQPRWGRERQPNQGACFYEDINFSGDYFCVRQGDRLTSMPSGMGDRISSVRVLGNAEVTIFRDSNLRGRSARLINDERDLRGEGWNDQISSVDVSLGRDYSSWGNNTRNRNGNGNGYGYGNGNGRARGRAQQNGRWSNDNLPVWGRNQPMPREGACFYEDADFRGDYFCAPRGATYTSLPRGFNDRISSVRVFGAEVRIFQDSNFRGRSQEIRGNARNLRGNWGDHISSIRVF